MQLLTWSGIDPPCQHAMAAGSLLTNVRPLMVASVIRVSQYARAPIITD